ncbi:MAG: PQQ-binding-like beta-propeller repeat protein, partial [Candidatus Binatia bacterium]
MRAAEAVRHGRAGLSRRRFLQFSALLAAGVFCRRASGDPGGLDAWTSHGYDLRQTRHNPREARIGPATVADLALAWEFEAGSGITSTPAIVGDRVVFGSWDGNVYALSLRSGKLLWKCTVGTRHYPPDRELGVYASAALSRSTVYVACDRLVAISLDDGKVRWERTIGAPEKTLEYFWASPIVDRGRLYAGVSAGSETRTRGRIVCLDAGSGEVLWTFFTVAEDVAGGALVAAPSLDVRTGTLWTASGNPFHLRPGPLRHSVSLLALDAASGKLLWADQVHPRDDKNLDLNCPPVLLTVHGAGKPLRLVVTGGKDGLRAWDRDTKRRFWHVQLTPVIPEKET